MWYTPQTSQTECTKQIDVLNTGALLGTFGCQSEVLELHRLQEDTTLELSLTAQKTFTLLHEELDQVVLYVAPGTLSLYAYIT